MRQGEAADDARGRAPERDRGGRWAYLAVSALARATVGFQFQAAPAMAAPLAAGLGLTLAEIGVLTGLYMLPGVVVSLIAGVALQRVGVRSAFAASLGVMAAGGILAATAEGFATLAAARVLAGAGAVVLTVAALKGLYDRFGLAELPTANGISSGSQPFGIGCALLAFGALGAGGDWRAGFMATAAVAVAGLGAAFVVIAGRDPGAERPVASGGPRPGPARGERAGLVLSGLAIAPFVGCFYAFLSFFPAHLAAFDWPPATAGLALGLLGWAPIVAAPLGGWIATRTGRPTTLAAVCMTGWGLTVVAAGLTGPTPALYALMLLLGPLPVGVMMSLPARVVAPERRGAASGIFMAFMFGGTTAFPALAGWVGERFGDAALPAAATAVTFCGAAFLSALVPLLLLERLAGRRTQAA